MLPSNAAESGGEAGELAAIGHHGTDELFCCPLVNCIPKGGVRLVVYLDLVIFLNFAVDFLLLLGTNRLTGYPSSVLRCVLAAGLGSVYGAVCLMEEFSFLGSLHWRLVSLVIMALLAFGWNINTLRRGCVFVILSMALGGMALGAQREELLSVIVCAVVLYGLCRVGFAGEGQTYRLLKLRYSGKTVTLLALQDTGNTLRDPITGESVVVISAEAACRLTGLQEKQLRDPLGTLSSNSISGLRLIPYRTVASSGMLLGLRIPDCEMDGKPQSLLVAFAPEGLGKEQMYQALTGGVL